jgi:hypothetical protein
MLARLANAGWYLAALPESRAFRRALHDVAGTQERVLQRILRGSAASEWGRRYQFARLRSVSDYQHAVPLTTYADYQADIERIAEGHQGILTSERVLLLEPSSGSTAATKLIPYTRALKAEFQRAIAPWVVNLFSHLPGLFGGAAYWSVSPATRRNQRTAGGIPVGFAHDSAYMGWLQQWLLGAVMAVPPQVRLVDDIDTFRYLTLLFLLQRPDLRLISVWNPSFLTLLVERLAEWWPALVADIARGTLTPPAPLAPATRIAVQPYHRPDPRRAAAVADACRAAQSAAERHRHLWPHLRLISSWTDARAAPLVPDIARHFPQARIQGKGLLATEGCITLPLLGVAGALPALRSHLLEFLPLHATAARPLLVHELEPATQYAVVLTTGGGLYRYQLHDIVEVVGHLAACPVLRFVGKQAHISDHRGEKLNAAHVQAALDEVLRRYGLAPPFAMLACEELPDGAAYVLFIAAPTASTAHLRRLGAALDAALRANYHYAYCRDLGQLAALRVFRIAAAAQASYLRRCQALGQRLGNIKPTALHQYSGWLAEFEGALLPLEEHGGEG